MIAELQGLKATLAQSQQREKKSGSLVQELTAMVKEQKNRISELIKAKREAVTDLKVRRRSKRKVRDLTGFKTDNRDDQFWASVIAFSKIVQSEPVGDGLLWDVVNSE